MLLERRDHEVLSVETIVTPTQTAEVRRHYTMFAHVKMTAPVAAAVGATVQIQGQLNQWDTREPITTEERDLTVRVNGQEVAALTTSGGQVTLPLRFDAVGTYHVTVTGDLVTGASLEVVVA